MSARIMANPNIQRKAEKTSTQGNDSFISTHFVSIFINKPQKPHLYQLFSFCSGGNGWGACGTFGVGLAGDPKFPTRIKDLKLWFYFDLNINFLYRLAGFIADEDKIIIT